MVRWTVLGGYLPAKVHFLFLEMGNLGKTTDLSTSLCFQL